MLCKALWRTLVAALLTGVLCSQAAPSQVVVVSVGEGRAAAELRSGDRLLSWQRETGSDREHAHGALTSPFDLSETEWEEGARGAVRFFGQRGDEERSWLVEMTPWRIEARPELSPDHVELFERAEGYGAAEEWNDALEA